MLLLELVELELLGDLLQLHVELAEELFVLCSPLVDLLLKTLLSHCLVGQVIQLSYLCC